MYAMKFSEFLFRCAGIILCAFLIGATYSIAAGVFVFLSLAFTLEMIVLMRSAK
jgi:hypothetical protein